MEGKEGREDVEGSDMGCWRKEKGQGGCISELLHIHILGQHPDMLSILRQLASHTFQ